MVGWPDGGVLASAARVLVVLAGLCAAAAAGGYYFWGRQEAETHRFHAQQAMADDDFEGAKAQLNAYLAARPEDGEAHFLLARACRRARVEDFGQARRQLEEARRRGVSGTEAALEAEMLDVQENGLTNDRETTLRDYLSSGQPGGGLVLEALARGCLLDNRLNDANARLNAWVERDPDDWYAHFWRGALFEYLSKANLAVADFECALQKRPADPKVRMRLGLALVQSGYDYDKALQYLESYRRGRPDDADVLVGIAQCRRALRQPEEARALLRQVVAAHPDHADALLTLALVEVDRGDDPAALEWLQRLEPLARRSHEPEDLARLRRLEPAPDHADVTHLMRATFNLFAAVLGRLGRNEEARRYEREAEQVAEEFEDLKKTLRERDERPRDVAVLDKLGALYLRLGMADEGVVVLKRVLRDKADDPQAHRALADYYAGRDDPESRRLAEEHRRLAGAAPLPPDPPRP